MPTKKHALPPKRKAENTREAPAERALAVRDIALPVMNNAQLQILTGTTPAHAIRTREGPNGTVLRYVPHGYVTDTLNKAFGLDWDYRLLPVFPHGSIYELKEIDVKNAKGQVVRTERYVAVYGELTVRVHDPKDLRAIIATITKPGPGSIVWRAGMEFGDAIKGAKSDGLKVAAHELGIALDLYYDDQAEYEAFEKQKADRAAAAAAEVDKLVKQVPATLPVLISRASTELDIDVKQLVELAGGASMAELMAWDAKQIGELWQKLLDSKAVDGVVEE